MIQVLAQNGYADQIIGGYDPQSWDSLGYYHLTSLDPQRTAFLFNLTTTTIQRQKLNTSADPYYYGEYQTYNTATDGPTFGGGYDLHVYNDLTTGYGQQYSYGPAGYDGLNIAGRQFDASAVMVFGAIEVYMISDSVASAPEPSTLTLLAFGGVSLLGYAGLRRRKKPVIA